MSWTILINHLNNYVSQHRTLDENLTNQIMALLTKMETDIHNVYTKIQLTEWLHNMQIKSSNISNMLSDVPIRQRAFIYEHQTLFINNVMENISAKIEILIRLRDINIEFLKRDFTFADPALYFSNDPSPAPHNPKTNLAELLHAFKKLSERG